MSQRTERLDELLRQEIRAMLEREIADPRIGLATVPEVETSPDLHPPNGWASVVGRAPRLADVATTRARAHQSGLEAFASVVPRPVVEAISNARSILAVGHENPDADTLGATLAIAVIARELGIRATAASSDVPPPLYA